MNALDQHEVLPTADTKGWTLRKLVIVAILGFAGLQIAGNIISVSSIQQVLNNSQTVQTETLQSAEKMNQLSKQVIELKSSHLLLLKATQELLQATNNVGIGIYRFISQYGENTEPLEMAHKQLLSIFTRVQELWNDKDSTGALKDMASDVSIMSDIIHELLETSSPVQLEELDEDAKAGAESLTKSANKLRDSLYQSINIITTDIEQQGGEVLLSITRSESAAKSSADGVLWLRIIGISIAVIMVSTLIVLGVFLCRSITNPVSEISAAMTRIAQGDLSTDCKIQGKTELTALGHLLNKFTEKLGSEFNLIKSEAEQVVAETKDNQCETEKLLNDVSRQRVKATDVLNAMEDAVATVDRIRQNTSKSAEAASDASTEFASVNQIVALSVNAISTVAATVNQSSTNVEELTNLTQEIGGVVEIITGIAEQTNLLALNAAIEAARAGEQGRGFAVVADEVRDLANRTQDSTSKIENIINNLQNCAQDVRTCINKGQELSDQYQQQNDFASETLEKIATTVALTDTLNSQIEYETTAQSTALEVIANNVSEMVEMLTSTESHCQQSEQNGSVITQKMGQLNGLVQQYKTNSALN